MLKYEGKYSDTIPEVLENCGEVLAAHRRDKSNVRFLIPPLILQQRNDQTCYDFLKWYATSALQPEYDWDNLEQPFLDLVGENAFEAVRCLLDLEDTPFLIAATLLKLRILLDLKEMAKRRLDERRRAQMMEARQNIFDQYRRFNTPPMASLCDPSYIAKAAESSLPWSSPANNERKGTSQDEDYDVAVSPSENNTTKACARRNSLHAPHTNPIKIKFRSSIDQTTKDLHTWGNWFKLMRYFETKVDKLYLAVRKRYQIVWGLLAGRFMASDPKHTRSPTIIDMHREALSMDSQYHRIWNETEGASAWLSEKLEN